MPDRDEGLERLLDLDGFLADVGDGYWVKFVVKRVPADSMRPHGLAYTLTLHDSSGERVFGIDNAHMIRRSGPAGRASPTRDHMHRGERVTAYPYRDAETLMDDFWREVAAILKQENS